MPEVGEAFDPSDQRFEVHGGAVCHEKAIHDMAMICFVAAGIPVRRVLPDLLPVPSLSALLLAPRSAMAAVAARADTREGLRPMLLLGVLHAAFSLLLFLAGHAPKMGIPGLPRETHYLIQAVFLVPLYLVLWQIGARVAHALARLSNTPERRPAALAVFGVAYAAPMILLFLVPDILVFALLGFDRIGKLMRYYAPLAAASSVTLGALGLRSAFSIGNGRAFFASLAGFLAQAVVGGVFLR